VKAGGFLAMKRFLCLYGVVLGFLFLPSCGPEEPPIDSFEYGDLFENVADNMIVPRYAQFQSNLLALQARLNAFDASDVQTLISLQEQFKATYLSWQSVSAFEFGPAAEYSALLRINCNSFPALTDTIEENIQFGTYNLDFPSNYQAKGLPAFDYLLFHADQNELLLELNDPSRIAYLQDCLADMQGRVDEVVNAWDSYRDIFVSSYGNDQSSSLSLLFNYFLYDYEQIKRNKFALPAGFATSFGIPIAMDTSKVEGFYSGKSFELIHANLTALESVYLGIGENGIDGIGIYEMLKAYNAISTVVDGDLSEAIADQFVLCKELVNQFANDLPYEIVNNISQVQETSNELQKMVPMIKNDMRSYFSVTVTLGDSDGD
jgi:uncharacterized protein